MSLSRRTLMLATAALAATHARAAANTLTIGTAADPVTLDPAFAGSIYENAVLDNVHDTLLTTEPDGTLRPGLAEAWEMTEPLTVRLRLRPNLTFHDGTPVDAEAVRFNLARYLDPATGSIRRGDLGPVTLVAARDAGTVEIGLSEPYAALPTVLAGRAGMIVSPSALTRLGADFASRAVGCGPYRVASWTRNDELRLEAYPGYWRGAPGFARVAFRPIADETARVANLRSGAVDLIDAVPPQALAALDADASVRVARAASIGFSAFSFNCTRKPFDDARVRQAFVAAIDPEVVQRVVYFGTGRVAHGPLSPAVAWAFDPGFAPPRFDPARARRLLNAAGHAAPVPLTITVTSAALWRRAAEVLQAQANAAGFDVTLRQIDGTALLATLRSRDFDLCMSPWSGRYDPDGNMFGWLSQGGAFNFSGYASAEMTELLRQARRDRDHEFRARLYRAAQALAADDAPMLFLHFDAILQAAASRLRWTQYPDAVLRLFDAVEA